MGIIGSMRKSWKLQRISKILGKPPDPSRWLDDLQSGATAQARDELLALCETDPHLRLVLTKHGASRAQLQETFERLLHFGAGQWIAGHYVAASALVFPATLDFILTNAGGQPWEKIVVLLLEYFERGDIGPVPLEVRGPANPNDPLQAIWELEQRTKGKR